MSDERVISYIVGLLLAAIVLTMLFFLAGCVTVRYGDAEYTRWFGEENVEDLSITTPEGLKIELGSAQGKSSDSFEAIMKAVYQAGMKAGRAGVIP